MLRGRTSADDASRCLRLSTISLFLPAADTPIEEFTPTPAFPALQYLESVDEGGVAWQAGLRTGDFLIEVRGGLLPANQRQGGGETGRRAEGVCCWSECQ